MSKYSFQSKCIYLLQFPICFWESLFSLKPTSPKGDQHLISPYNVNKETVRPVRRISLLILGLDNKEYRVKKKNKHLITADLLAYDWEIQRNSFRQTNITLNTLFNKINFYTILKDIQYRCKVLLNIFQLNGHTIGFLSHQKTKKLTPHNSLQFDSEITCKMKQPYKNYFWNRINANSRMNARGGSYSFLGWGAQLRNDTTDCRVLVTLESHTSSQAG